MCDYDDMYKSICRLCLTQSGVDKMISLFDNLTENKLSTVGKAVTIVTNVLISKNDKLPYMACFKCVYLLKQTIYFMLKCESSDRKLKQLINFDENNGIDDHNIKEKVCDYLLFSQYFSTECYEKSTIKKKNPKTKTRIENHKTLQNSSMEYAQIDNNTNSIYDFEEFIDNNKTNESIDDKYGDNSDEINNILDSIQYIIKSETNIQANRRKKIKKRHQPQFKKNKERNIICNICHKILANHLTYNHHMQRHSLCRFICDQCGKGFPVLAEMHMHQIAKHGIGPYLKCDHCSYKASRKLNLIEHLRIHTGERPFTCEKCGLTFRRRAIWRNHLLTHMEKKHQCLHCPRKFFLHSQMLSHCNNVHERMYMYMCKICSVTYTKTETVRRHMNIKHGIPREKQGKIVRITRGSNEFNNQIT